MLIDSKVYERDTTTQSLVFQQHVRKIKMALLKRNTHRVLLFSALFAAMNFSVCYANNLYFSLLPNYVEIYGFSSLQTALCSSIFTFPNFVLPMFMGILVDRLGTTRCFAFSIAFVAAGSIILALSVLPTSSTAVFIVVLLSRACLAMGGQSIFTSHDVLHVKVFGVDLVSSFLPISMMAGKFGSTAVFFLSPVLADALSLSAAMGAGLAIILPVIPVSIAILILHGVERIKTRSKTTKATVHFTDGLVSPMAVPISTSQGLGDDEVCYVVQSYPGTPHNELDNDSVGTDGEDQDVVLSVFPEPTGQDTDLDVGQDGFGVDDLENQRAGPLRRSESSQSLVEEYVRGNSDDESSSEAPEPIGPPVMVSQVTQTDPPRHDEDPTISGDELEDLEANAGLMARDQILTEAIAQLENKAVIETVDISLTAGARDTLATSPAYWALVAAIVLLYSNIFAFPAVGARLIMDRDSNFTVAEAGRVVSLYFCCLGFSPLWPKIIAKVGKRPLFIATAAILNIMTLTVFVMTTFTPYILLAISGMALSIVSVAGYSSVPLTLKPSQHGVAFGVLTSAVNVGTGVSQFVVITLADVQWRYAVFYFIALDIIAIGVSLLLTRLDRRTGGRLMERKVVD